MNNNEPSNAVNQCNINDETLGEMVAFVFRMRLFFGQLLPLIDEFSKEDYGLDATSVQLIASTRRWAERKMIETNDLIVKLSK